LRRLGYAVNSNVTSGLIRKPCPTIKTMDREIKLKDESIGLAPYRSSDIDVLYGAVRESIPMLSKWLPWCHPGYSIEESRLWIESRYDAWIKGIEYDFCIIDIKNGSFLGGCGLNQINYVHRFSSLGYWVRSTRTGEGIAAKAARLVSQFAFDALNLKRIEIVIACENKKSLRVAEKLGATREGILRNRLVMSDKVYDAIVFSLIPNDLMQPKQKA